jgi:hypothetical protein
MEFRFAARGPIIRNEQPPLSMESIIGEPGSGSESSIENYSMVKNHTDNRHGIIGYLDDPSVAKRITDALKVQANVGEHLP